MTEEAGAGRRGRIEARLTEHFRPTRLEVVDESRRHEGHAGWQPGGGTHMRVRIAAAAFVGLGRVARHRLVNMALSDEFAGGLHALAIEADEPEPSTVR